MASPGQRSKSYIWISGSLSVSITYFCLHSSPLQSLIILSYFSLRTQCYLWCPHGVQGHTQQNGIWMYLGFIWLYYDSQIIWVQMNSRKSKMTLARRSSQIRKSSSNALRFRCYVRFKQSTRNAATETTRTPRFLAGTNRCGPLLQVWRFDTPLWNFKEEHVYILIV